MKNKRGQLYFFLGMIFLWSFSCEESTNTKPVSSNINSEIKGAEENRKGKLTRDENGKLSLEQNGDSQGLSKKFVPDEDFLNNIISESSEKERKEIISKLKPSSKEYFLRFLTAKDSMTVFLSHVLNEVKKENVNINHLTFMEGKFYEIKKRFEDDQAELRKNDIDEYKIIYSLLAKEMDRDIKPKFFEFKSISKSKNIGLYQDRKRNI